MITYYRRRPWGGDLYQTHMDDSLYRDDGYQLMYYKTMARKWTLSRFDLEASDCVLDKITEVEAFAEIL